MGDQIQQSPAARYLPRLLADRGGGSNAHNLRFHPVLCVYGWRIQPFQKRVVFTTDPAIFGTGSHGLVR
jgi:hypothetical protein